MSSVGRARLLLCLVPRGWPACAEDGQSPCLGRSPALNVEGGADSTCVFLTECLTQPSCPAWAERGWGLGDIDHPAELELERWQCQKRASGWCTELACKRQDTGVGRLPVAPGWWPGKNGWCVRNILDRVGIFNDGNFRSFSFKSSN